VALSALVARRRSQLSGVRPLRWRAPAWR